MFRLFTTISLLLALFLMLGSPVHTEAGVFSYISKLRNQPQVAVPFEALNSQNMMLLQSHSAPDASQGKGGGDVTIVGKSALLPDAGPLGTIADIEDGVPQGEEISIYVVRKGDTIKAIADMFGVSSNTIIWANDISGNVIREGQSLVILPVSGVQHVVTKGDTLESVAKKYRTDVLEIAKFNGLAVGSKLSVGDELIIPDGELATPVARRSAARARVYGTNGPSYDGYYLYPVPGARKTQGLHGFNGVDLGAPMNEPILASADGIVIIARSSGWNSGYGKYLVISHPNGTQTLYAHANQLLVDAAQVVRKGQLIGLVGSTGKSTGPHVHFEVRGAKNPF